MHEDFFSELITFCPNKFLNAIFDQLLFVLRYLRELRGYFV